MNKTSKIIAITGATASGKSKLALELAKELNGEIINADSVQVYSKLDIGSAKPTKSELAEVPHHLVSYVEPNQDYSAGMFRKDCLSVVEHLEDQGKLPLVVGGSGLYLSALFSRFLDDGWFVANLEETFLVKVKNSKSPDDYNVWCNRLLSIVDSHSNRYLEPNDIFRRERALALSLSLGSPASALKKHLSREAGDLGGLVIVVERNRDDLYRRIDSRVDSMIEEGLIQEVTSIIKEYGESISSLKAIGYKQVVDYLSLQKQGLSPNQGDLIKIIQRDTRRFAKRQLTWWRNQPSKLAWRDIFSLPFIKKELEEVLNSCPPDGGKVSVKRKQNFGLTSSLRLVDHVLEGKYVEISLFLKYVIDNYLKDNLHKVSQSLVVTSSDNNCSYFKNDQKNRVYVCRVRFLD